MNLQLSEIGVGPDIIKPKRLKRNKMIGLSGSYIKFIKAFSKIAFPITSYLKISMSFKCS